MLAHAAEIYRSAIEAGDRAPVQTVADKLGRARPTAGRYIAQARKAGLLPPTTPGRAQA